MYLVGVGAGEVEVGDGGSLLRAEDIHAWGLTVERLAQLHHVRPRALELPEGRGGEGGRGQVEGGVWEEGWGGFRNRALKIKVALSEGRAAVLRGGYCRVGDFWFY